MAQLETRTAPQQARQWGIASLITSFVTIGLVLLIVLICVLIFGIGLIMIF